MALLSRLPPEGRKRSGNKADKEPDGSGVRQGIRGADPLGKSQKAHSPADPQGKENMPIFSDPLSGMGQCLHHGAVYVEHHSQYAARDAGQDRPSAEVVAAGMVRLRWIALFYGLDAIMDVIVGSLRGVGYNILPMLVTLMGACASRLIWLSTVFRLPAYHRIEMVYIVYPLSWALTATTHLICYFFVSRKVDRELRAHEAELAAQAEESPEEADS